MPTLEPRLIYLCLSGMFQTGLVEIKGEEALFLTEKGKRRYSDLMAREGDDVQDMQDEAREVLRAEFSKKAPSTRLITLFSSMKTGRWLQAG